jgi:hypothetical protein
MNRQAANKAILKLLEDFLSKNPDIRFTQALVALGVTEDVYDFQSGNRFNHIDFYEEPQDTLTKVSERKVR